uniref:Secreted protein n=1 Tax=Brassica campestris TaxID=3711 RepID=A0A3P5ZW31_BRACM|nr:unnamed protein product [Brassica rapa]
MDHHLSLLFYFLLPCELWRSVYSETSFFSPCCRRVLELVVMARGVLQRRATPKTIWEFPASEATRRTSRPHGHRLRLRTVTWFLRLLKAN